MATYYVNNDPEYPNWKRNPVSYGSNNASLDIFDVEYDYGKEIPEEEIKEIQDDLDKEAWKIVRKQRRRKDKEGESSYFRNERHRKEKLEELAEFINEGGDDYLYCAMMHENDDIKAAVAYACAPDSPEMYKLSVHPHHVVRMAVAEKIDDPSVLANDREGYIRLHIAERVDNPEIMMNDRDEEIRRVVAERIDNPERIKDDKSAKVRRAVAERIDDFKPMMYDDDITVQVAAGLRIDDIDFFMQHPDKKIRDLGKHFIYYQFGAGKGVKTGDYEGAITKEDQEAIWRKRREEEEEAERKRIEEARRKWREEQGLL